MEAKIEKENGPTILNQGKLEYAKDRLMKLFEQHTIIPSDYDRIYNEKYLFYDEEKQYKEYLTKALSGLSYLNERELEQVTKEVLSQLPIHGKPMEEKEGYAIWTSTGELEMERGITDRDAKYHYATVFVDLMANNRAIQELFERESPWKGDELLTNLYESTVAHRNTNPTIVQISEDLKAIRTMEDESWKKVGSVLFRLVEIFPTEDPNKDVRVVRQEEEYKQQWDVYSKDRVLTVIDKDSLVELQQEGETKTAVFLIKDSQAEAAIAQLKELVYQRLTNHGVDYYEAAFVNQDGQEKQIVSNQADSLYLFKENIRTQINFSFDDIAGIKGSKEKDNTITTDYQLAKDILSTWKAVASLQLAETGRFVGKEVSQNSQENGLLLMEKNGTYSAIHIPDSYLPVKVGSHEGRTLLFKEKTLEGAVWDLHQYMGKTDTQYFFNHADTKTSIRLNGADGIYNMLKPKLTIEKKQEQNKNGLLSLIKRFGGSIDNLRQDVNTSEAKGKGIQL